LYYPSLNIMMIFCDTFENFVPEPHSSQKHVDSWRRQTQRWGQVGKYREWFLAASLQFWWRRSTTHNPSSNFPEESSSQIQSAVLWTWGWRCKVYKDPRVEESSERSLPKQWSRTDSWRTWDWDHWRIYTLDLEFSRSIWNLKKTSPSIFFLFHL